MRLRVLSAVLLANLMAVSAHAGTVTGSIQRPNGQPLANGVVTFSLSQAGVTQAGSITVTSDNVYCGTSSSGTVVGVTDPAASAVLSANYGAGTLPATQYYVEYTYTTGAGESFTSPETTFLMTSNGTLNGNAPLLQPGNATGYKVYIGTTSGGETLQQTSVGFAGWSQSAALGAGAAPPVSNSTLCNTLIFNDAITPSYTTYLVNLLDSKGKQVSGYPQRYYFSGATLDLSTLAPAANLYARFPNAIVAQPGGNGLQSIAGPLSLGSNTLFAGSAALSSESITNAGLFDNSTYNQYFTMAIGGCSNQNLYSLLNGGNETAAFNACIKVPVGATQRQNDAIAGMVDQFSGTGSPAVGVFGGALGDSTNARGWGANFVYIDNGFATPNGYSAEFDYDNLSTGSVPHGILVTGLWHAQATQGEALGIAQNDTTFHWPIGIRFFTGATNALDNGDAAIEFNATSAANNSPSQGFNMFAIPSGGGLVGVSVKLLPTGILNIDNPGNTHTVTGINLNNIPLSQTIGSGTSTSNGTAILNGVSQAQPAITINGATTGDVASCSLNAAPPATWQTGIQFLLPVVTANTVTPWLSNPTAASITPVAAVIRCSVRR